LNSRRGIIKLGSQLVAAYKAFRATAAENGITADPTRTPCCVCPVRSIRLCPGARASSARGVPNELWKLSRS
jgi:hypothetical protein